MPRQYQWVTAEMVEQHFTETVAEFFRSYPDPVPQYQYLDGLRGRGLLESALGVCLRNNVLNYNRLYQSYYYDIMYKKAYYSRIGSACNAIRL